jgi:hypothetical protein
VVNTPFVRIGAVVICASCQHRYLTDQTHIKRVPSSAKTGEGKPAEPDTASGEAGTSPQAGEPQPGRVHGLSEMMRAEAERERDSQFDDYDTIAPEPDRPGTPAAAIPEPAVPIPPMQPTPSRQQKAIRSGHLLAAAGALALAVLGIAIWSIDWQQGSGPATQEQLEPEPDPGPVYEGPFFQGLPLIESVLLGHSPWEQPNRPFVSAPQKDSEVYLADVGLLPAGAGVIEYVGRVVSERPGVIMAGELVISLVNPQGTEKARTTTPIALIKPDLSMAVHVPIPANLDPTALHPAWAINIQEVAESAVFLEDVSLETESMGADTMARIVLGNDTGAPVQRVTLVITAWGDEDRPLRRWRVDWQLPIEKSDYVEFFTRTGVNPSWNIRRWTVAAAAVAE